MQRICKKCKDFVRNAKNLQRGLGGSERKQLTYILPIIC